MVPQLLKVTRKGQITIPVEVRREMGIGEGDFVTIIKQGNDYTLVNPVELVRRTAGSLAKYVKNGPLEWDGDEIWTEMAMERWNRLQDQLKEEQGDET